MVQHILIGLAVIILGFFGYRAYAFRTASRRMNRLRSDRVKSLLEGVDRGHMLSKEDILPFFRDRQMRHDAYSFLSASGRLNEVPPEFNNATSLAESHLSVWLEFPTELNAPPDEVVHLGRVRLYSNNENGTALYEVFKYRTHPPHWASREGWLLGTVGPIEEVNGVIDTGHAFSRFLSINSSTPEDEARWMNEKILSSGKIAGPLLSQYEPVLDVKQSAAGS